MLLQIQTKIQSICFVWNPICKTRSALNAQLMPIHTNTNMLCTEIWKPIINGLFHLGYSSYFLECEGFVDIAGVFKVDDPAPFSLKASCARMCLEL